jgi:adenosylcobinamide amidohydrolase
LETKELRFFTPAQTQSNGRSSAYAMRAGSDKPAGKRSTNLGTINIFVFTLNDLSDPAMFRTIITVTEAKCAALQELGIRSSYNQEFSATGTGTDNIVIVPGKGEKIELLRGHSRLSLSVGEAVHTAMKSALLGIE